MGFVAAMVKSSSSLGKEELKITAKRPYTLSKGVDIKSGNISARTTKRASLLVRADSVLEFNEIMEEVSFKTSMNVWAINRLHVYNPQEGAELFFLQFNPNGIGSFLYLFHFEKAERKGYFFEISINDQQRLVGNFQDNLAHCTLQTTLAPACALKKKVKSKEIRLRKNK